MMVITGHPEANGAAVSSRMIFLVTARVFLCENIYISNTSRSRFHSKYSFLYGRIRWHAVFTFLKIGLLAESYLSLHRFHNESSSVH